MTYKYYDRLKGYFKPEREKEHLNATSPLYLWFIEA